MGSQAWGVGAWSSSSSCVRNPRTREMPHKFVVSQKNLQHLMALHSAFNHFQPFSTFESSKSCHINLASKITPSGLLGDIPNVQVLATLRLWSKQWKVYLQPRDSRKWTNLPLKRNHFKRKVTYLSTIILHKLYWYFRGRYIHGRLSYQILMPGALQMFCQTIFFRPFNQCVSFNFSARWDAHRLQQRWTKNHKLVFIQPGNFVFFFQNSSWRKSELNH